MASKGDLMARGIGFSGAVLFLLLFAVALGAIVVIRHGVSARDQPTQGEIFVARRLRHLAIPLSARQMSSPEAMTPATVKAGLEHFADHCAICHANDGSGDTEIGRNLYPKAPDMRREDTQALSDGELFYIIENGIRFTGMPGWGTSGDTVKPGAEAGHDTSEAGHDHEGAGHDTWALVHFIRHLPKLTEAEQQQMKALNPKSPEEWEQEQQIQQFLKGGDTTAAPPVESSGHEHPHK
jgi:mono/diheme cytochrome c family protein